MDKSKERILFLDLMRAFAVFMMIQGHTIHALLSTEYTSGEYLLYNIWHFFRGFTAPIFMFTAGTVFTYLLIKNPISFSSNERVSKGIKRFFVLLLIGYFLRYPTHRFFDYSNVTIQQWQIFFAVDALHLIAFGLLFIILVKAVSEYIGINPMNAFISAALFFFLLNPAVALLDWNSFLPLPIASYFTTKTGSIFPLFPWAGYLLAGAVLGTYFRAHKNIFKDRKFALNLILLGVTFSLGSILFDRFESLFYGSSNFLALNLSLSFYRIGVVLMLNGVFLFITLKFKSVPNIVRTFGKHSLIIYVIHLIIIYGSAFVPGLSLRYGKSLEPITVVMIALTLIICMLILSLFIDKASPFLRKINLAELIKRKKIQLDAE